MREIIEAFLISVAVVVFGLIVLFGAKSFSDAAHAPTQTAVRTWQKADSKAYAMQGIQAFADKEYVCLTKLWGKESAWNPKAINPKKVGGLHAGGIPQLLGMSPKLTPAKQIDIGLKYIYHRYETPCNAWSHWKKLGWY